MKKIKKVSKVSSVNKKILNATPKEYNGIKFKSLLEVKCYRMLLEAGFRPEYEARRITIWKGFFPTVPFYNRNKKSRELIKSTSKILDITYTPDFVFNYHNMPVFIEVKGYENEVYPLKKKIFRKYLETYVPNGIYFEVRSIREINRAIEILKEYKLHKNESRNNKNT